MTSEKFNIPVLDLSPEIDMLWDELQAAIQGVMRTGHFIMGPNVKAFEQEVAAYLGVKHAIGVNSGTDALFLALRALGVGPGDEVITSPFTFFATAEAVSHVGAIPVFVDIDPETFNIDVKLVEAAITSRTKVIIPVHLYGHASDMGRLMELAERYGLKVVEDAAQAFGGECGGVKVGTIGAIGAYSFFPSKNLGAFGDGGLITTNEDSIADSCRMLRAHGSRKKYLNEVVGYNSRLDEIQAAVLRVKLPHVIECNEGRRRVAATYNELLADVPVVVLPREAAYAHHVYHQYTIRILNGRRDYVQDYLAQVGIASMVYYPTPVHRLPPYIETSPALETAERFTGEVLSLPIWPQMPSEVIHRVVDEIKRALACT